MKFYTSVNRYKNDILYRGFNHAGVRVESKEKFSPTLYTTSSSDSGWSTLRGHSVEPKAFKTMSSARQFLDAYSEVEGYEIHGTTNYVHQFITDRWPNEIPYKEKWINTTYMDIEVDSAGKGFPEPSEAIYPVTAITIKSSNSESYITWSLKDWDRSESQLDVPVIFKHCRSENELLALFLAHWCKNYPDIITGYNVLMFDIPYLVNRLRRIGSEEAALKISPWGHINSKTKRDSYNNDVDVYEIVGIQTVDYMVLFKKFGYSYGTLESYSLAHVAHVVLGEAKLSYDEYGTLANLWEQNPQLYIDYNIKDVMLIVQLEEKLKLISLAMTMAYMAGVNIADTFGTVAIWDSIIYRELNRKKIAVPPSAVKSKQSYPGGYVKDPQLGMKDWLVSFDLNSLYPNLIVQYNMSPETIVNGMQAYGADHYMDSAPMGGDYAVAANGAMFSKDRLGVLPEIIMGLYDQRRVIKGNMLKAQQEFESHKSSDAEANIIQLNNGQMAVKILLNSLYGALANKYFRYFDMRIAEGITLSGQLSIRWAEREANREMNKLLKSDGVDYVVAMDTDSLYMNFGPMIEKLRPENPVEAIDKICESHFVNVFNDAYKRLHENMNSYTNRMVMAREAIADRGFWTAKKRYILNVHNNEGVQYAEPKIKVSGIEAIKSSTPQVVRDKMRDIFKIIMSGTEREMQDDLVKFKADFENMPAADISFPRGISDVEKWADPVLGYKKGTPIHVRAALVYNTQVNKLALSGVHDVIGSGDKIKFCYLKTPNPTGGNVIGFPQYLPKEFGIERYVDYEVQYKKTFLGPIVPILDAIGWKAEEIHTLDSFF